VPVAKTPGAALNSQQTFRGRRCLRRPLQWRGPDGGAALAFVTLTKELADGRE
jgi:hypothetical protein